ncbi:MAG: glycosyltransferase family 2 protein [Solirubrobacteraceae bacterium]|nr:glycosyltransferase family 2 protein [Solirubrobacteraceae bacterium]
MTRRGRKLGGLIRPAVRPRVVVRAAFTYAALSRLARGRERRGPLEVPAWAQGAEGAESLAGESRPRISVVVPARDEFERIAGVLAPLLGPAGGRGAEDRPIAPGVVEVIVVDDRSADGTADLARAHGARVIEGSELPTGWLGKSWALQQGLVAATGDIVVFLDADVQPDPRLPAAVAALLEDGANLASAQLAFEIPDDAQRILHPALLATLIYRIGPLDSTQRIPASVAGINGQCFAARRNELIGAGGFGLISAIPTDDIALARALSGAGWRIAVADGSSLGSVRMYESAAEAMREWAGRSLALPGASPRARQLFDLGVVWTVQGLPGLRVWRGLIRGLLRGSIRDGFAVLRPFDVAMLAIRWSLQLGLAQVYRRELSVTVGDEDSAVEGEGTSGLEGGVVSVSTVDRLALLAPFVDPIAAVALTRGTLAPVRRWRGREI